MRQFLLDIPDALIDSARTDGAGELMIFFRIILPLNWPALATRALLSFTGNSDSILWPLVVINYDEYRTLPLADVAKRVRCSLQRTHGRLAVDINSDCFAVPSCVATL